MTRNTAASTSRLPSEIDMAVASRLRKLRLRAGMTLQDLAGRIGISLQQTDKYEIGANRISAGMLAKMADALGAEIMEFFEDRETPVYEKKKTSRTRHKLIRAAGCKS
jgi:transcriptional regulator with XRE-family HTH domain